MTDSTNLFVTVVLGFLSASIDSSTMPVHFTVAKHGAEPVQGVGLKGKERDDLLHYTWGVKAKTTRSSEILQSSVSTQQDLEFVHCRTNGFVDTVTTVYNQHHHLIIRPDDVWISILSQFNFYVNAHAEDLRSHFVKHEGKKELIIKAVGTRYSVDFGKLTHQMAHLIHENVVDKELKDWILPNFTTSTNHDTVICAVLMMATLKAYFDYGFGLCCGLSSVTLEGEKSDWEKLLARVDKLPTFGPEPAAWADLLRPILSRFVRAFDGEPDIDFWSRVCHFHPQGSGPTYLSGWITAFCVWDTSGKWRQSGSPGSPLMLLSGELVPNLVIDGACYPIIKSEDVPIGFCEVDVKLNDNGEEFDCMMVSGHLASLVVGDAKDSLRPFPSWFLFIKEQCEDPELVRMRNLMERYGVKIDK